MGGCTESCCLVRATLLFLIACMAPSLHAQEFKFPFTLDAEGWTGVNLPTASPPFDNVGSPISLNHSLTGGNPDGFISITDPDNGDFYFQAPASSLGNLARFLGGYLTYNIRIENNNYDSAPDIIIAGNGKVLVADIGVPGVGVWDTVVAPLTEEAAHWRLDSLSGTLATKADIEEVLSNVSLLRIRGEYVADQIGVEQGALDNVQLVPEVSSTAFVALFGIALCARLRSRFLRAVSPN